MTPPQTNSHRTVFRSLGRRTLIAAGGITFGFALASFQAQGSALLDPEPESSTTHFGYAMAVIGDIDADGLPDLAIGAPYQDGDFDNSDGGFGPPQNVGKVFLVNGLNLKVIRELDDPEFQMEQPLKFGGEFGAALAAVGDLNQDGISEILVGVPHHIEEAEEEEEEENAINAGEAFVFSGKDGAILYTLLSPEPAEGARFGQAVSGIADLNDDGVDDLLVGEPKHDLSEDVPDTGAVYIFSGADGTLLRTLLPPGTPNGRFGSALADAGDLQQDNVHDILVGEPGSGLVSAISGRTGKVIVSVSVGSGALPSFGYALAGGKDLNGDGKLDFVVGAPLEDKLTGSVTVFNGDGSTQRTLKADPETFSKFGSSVFLSDDLTGDGQPDIIVGAPDHTVNNLGNAGEVFIFRGQNGKLFRKLTSAAPKEYAGFGYVSVTADLIGNGKLSIITGAPFEDADLPEEDDVETHLQIGKVEVQ